MDLSYLKLIVSDLNVIKTGFPQENPTVSFRVMQVLD